MKFQKSNILQALCLLSLILLPFHIFTQIPAKGIPSKTVGSIYGGAMISAGIDYASAFDFSDKVSTVHIPQIRIKLESFFFLNPAYLYINLMAHVPFINFSDSILYYRSTRVAYSIALGFGFTLADKNIKTRRVLALMGFAMVVPVFKPVQSLRDSTSILLQESSWFPVEFGFLWEFRVMVGVRHNMGLMFGLGLEYMSPQLGYQYINHTVPRSLGSLTLLTSFTLAFF